MAEGPEDKLQQTQYAQPAVFVTCFALWQLCCAGEEPAAYVGHSLGEVTALAAAGAFTFAQGVELVAKRSECMAEPRGGMLAILGLEVEELESLCSQVQEEHWVQVANINAPGQIVVSGKEEGLAVVAGLAKERGARRVVPLKVSGPFQSQLMAPAAEAFGRYVAQLRIQDVTVPVVSNHTSELLSSGEQIRAELVDQLHKACTLYRELPSPRQTRRGFSDSKPQPSCGAIKGARLARSKLHLPHLEGCSSMNMLNKVGLVTGATRESAVPLPSISSTKAFSSP